MRKFVKKKLKAAGRRLRKRSFHGTVYRILGSQAKPALSRKGLRHGHNKAI